MRVVLNLGSQFCASESRFWVLKVKFKPLKITYRHLGVAFWTGGRFWVNFGPLEVGFWAVEGVYEL